MIFWATVFLGVACLAILGYVWWLVFKMSHQRRNSNPSGFEPGDELEIRAHGGGTRRVRIIGFTNTGKVLVDYGGIYFRRDLGTLQRLLVKKT